MMFFLVCKLTNFHGILAGREGLCFITSALQTVVCVQ